MDRIDVAEGDPVDARAGLLAKGLGGVAAGAGGGGGLVHAVAERGQRLALRQRAAGQRQGGRAGCEQPEAAARE
jgi:hypothetical protein